MNKRFLLANPRSYETVEPHFEKKLATPSQRPTGRPKNRKKIPKDLELPKLKMFSRNTHGDEVKQDVQKYFNNHPGELNSRMPDNRKDPKQSLKKYLEGTDKFRNQNFYESYPHFKDIFSILDLLSYNWSSNCKHLSYGMVDLPSGKMKSREGTVVDADDIMEEMTQTAKDVSQKLGKLDGLSEDEKNNVFKTVGLGALKYYILKVDPKKSILFDPKESVDFQGNTASFIQYSYARIQSILNGINFELSKDKYDRKLEDKEKELIKQIDLFPSAISSAASSHNPALVANYVYDLVKSFNSFYQSLPILKSAFEDKKTFRVELSKLVGITIKNALLLLGIGVVDRM